MYIVLSIWRLVCKSDRTALTLQVECEIGSPYQVPLKVSQVKYVDTISVDAVINDLDYNNSEISLNIFHISSVHFAPKEKLTELNKIGKEWNYTLRTSFVWVTKRHDFHWHLDQFRSWRFFLILSDRKVKTEFFNKVLCHFKERIILKVTLYELASGLLKFLSHFSKSTWMFICV